MLGIILNTINVTAIKILKNTINVTAIKILKKKFNKSFINIPICYMSLRLDDSM